MNRAFWKNRFFRTEDPLHYPCPFCNQGIYKLIGGKKVQKMEEIYQNDPPIESLASVILKCTHCNYPIAMIANYTQMMVEEHDEISGEVEYKDIRLVEPKFIYPPLPIIRCDYHLPTQVKKQLELSFSLFYYDLDACAAALRKTIEVILTDVGLTNTSLHNKIESIENEWIKSLFEGLKGMGNAGTHGNYVERTIVIDDILDGYELLESILDEYYYKKREVLENKAENLKDKFPNPNKNNK